MSGKNQRFEYGGYFLKRRPNSIKWCRAWFDPVTRQTRLASLGVSDFGEAQDALIEWVLEYGKVGEVAAEKLTMATVLQRYYLQRAKYLPPAGRNTQRRCLEIMTELTADENGSSLPVSAFKIAK